MTWPIVSPGSDLFELNAQRRSDIYDRDPFDDEEENLEDGELDDDDEPDEDEDEDEDEFDDDDDYDDDDEEEEEEEDDL